jgi:multiple sugar transport system substrate-binding protein
MDTPRRAGPPGRPALGRLPAGAASLEMARFVQSALTQGLHRTGRERCRMRLRPKHPGRRSRSVRRLALLSMCALTTGTLATLSACGTTSQASHPAASTSGSTVHPTSCKPGATKLTFWGWAPGYQLVVNEFNKTHPDICVTLEDNGAGIAEYTKLTAAVRAGAGAPDVAEVEYLELPSLVITHSLVNLVPYGVNAYRSHIVPFAWNQVSQGSAVYAMPGDIGPMAFYYNADLLSKSHIKPPATWAQFATDAAALHRADPSAYLANFDPVETQWLYALMQQAGCFPFKYSGGMHVTIDFTGPAQMAFASYWQRLISAHEINHTSDFSPIFWHNLDYGIDASWLSAAWSPADMAPNLSKTIGDWRAAPLPQESASTGLAGSWGGSTFAVVTGTKHPQQAAEFAEWYGGTLASWKILNSPAAGAFPGYTPLLDSPALQKATIPLSGSSTPNSVFVSTAAHVAPIQWPPFMTEALTEGESVFAGVLNGTETVQHAFQIYQADLVQYAKSQGFSVTQ